MNWNFKNGFSKVLHQNWGMTLLVSSAVWCVLGICLQNLSIDDSIRILGPSLDWFASISSNLFSASIATFLGFVLFFSQPQEELEKRMKDEASAASDRLTEEIKGLKYEADVASSHVNERLARIDSSLLNLTKFDVRMINLATDASVFAGFEGSFVAYNAPLLWEDRFLDRAIITHVLRYKDRRLNKAEYCYPILGCFSGDDIARIAWYGRIHRFFSILENVARLSSDDLDYLRNSIKNSGISVPDEWAAAATQDDQGEALVEALQLTESEKRKLRFFVPERSRDGYRMIDSNHGMTFFFGQRHSKKQIIYYQSNPLFLVGSEPKHALLIREVDFCDSAEVFHRSCTNGILSRRSLNLAEFLDQLEQMEHSLIPRNKHEGGIGDTGQTGLVE